MNKGVGVPLTPPISSPNMFCLFSLNSLSVRVPHKFSSRVVKNADPESVAGWLLAVAGTGFIVKPMVFQFFSASLLVKPMVFQQFRLLGL